MLRVGFDARPAISGRAGIGRYARELSGALSRLPDGPFLELYGAAWMPRRTEVDWWTPGRARLHRGWLPARAWRWLHAIPGCDAGRLPARVQVFHWTDFVYPPVRSAARVLTLHDAAFAVEPRFHGRNAVTLEQRVRAALACADRVIVVSEPGRAAADLLGVAEQRVRVVPNGVGEQFQPGPGPAASPPYVLSVGTLEPRKNYPRLLEALEHLWDRDLAPDWVLCGRRGWECDAFLARLDSSRHRRRIRWLQDVTDEQLPGLYQGAAALLYPSLYEGFGLPVLEAMACAVPVLVGIGTAPEWVAGGLAVTCDPRELDSVEAGIGRVLGAPPDRAGLLARASVFTWEKAARATAAVYRELIDPAGERVPKSPERSCRQAANTV